MKHLIAVSLAALTSAACSPRAPAPVASASPTEAPAPVAKRVALRDCATVEAKDEADKGWSHPACRLTSKGDGLLKFDVSYAEPATDKDGGMTTAVSIKVVQSGDAASQTITESMSNTFGAPSLEDIDHDGFEDLLVPLETGNVNTTYAIWHRPAGASAFIRVGEISAYGFNANDKGIVSASSRSAANIQDVAFFKLDGDKLMPIATAESTARGEPDKITGVDCVVTDDGGLKAMRMSVKQAQAKYCADPVVKDIFK